ncbi:MAG: hypothetical protein R3F17_12085 [Planctomycetota bacterium]
MVGAAPRRFACATVFSASTALLVVMAIGPGDDAGDAALPLGPSEGVPGYDHALRPGAELQGELRRRAPDQADHSTDPDPLVRELNRLVFESLAHAPAAPAGFRENWLAWALAQVDEELVRPQEPINVARGGRGLCHDSVAILVELAEQRGFEAKMLDLRGHVLACLQHQDREWVSDPDFGIVYPGSIRDLRQPAGIEWVRRSLAERGFAPRLADAYVAALETEGDDRFIPNARLSPRLAWLERLLSWLAWTIPAALWLGSVAFWRRGIRRTSLP